MIRLSVKGLADYMTASPTRQRSILRGYKYKGEDESRAKTLYYGEARSNIAAYHKNGHEPEWLKAKAELVAELAALSRGSRRIRLRNNVRALRSYERHFSDRPFEVIGPLRLHLDFAEVRLSVTPDLWVREGAKEKIVKLDFASKAPDGDVIKIISQCMFEAAKGEIDDCTSTSVLYLDVPRGREHRGARANARTLRDIEATCENISVLWESI